MKKLENTEAMQPKPEEQPKARAVPEKSVVISFRVSISEFEPFREPIEKSGLSRSEFFRRLFDEKKAKVVISEKKTHTADYTKYLHYVGKASNNLNQLAKLLNTAEKAGRVTTKQYVNAINNINSIRLMLLSKLGGRG